MATDDPATRYCRFIESVVNHRRLDQLDQFLSTEVVEHTPEPRVGIEAARQGLRRWLAAFPDLHLVIEDLVVEDDHLMARLTATGTHRGPLGGLAPTGRRVSVLVFEAWTVPDGRCAERWLHVDGCALLRQLGRPRDGAVAWHQPPAPDRGTPGRSRPPPRPDRRG
jgi:predicted ester cyclase